MTKVITVIDRFSDSEQEMLHDIIHRGGIVVYPTDTVYALAVNALNAEALHKLTALKGRETSKAFHVIVPSLKSALQYVETNNNAELLAACFFPGPVTLVMKAKPFLSSELLMDGTLGIRIPNHPIARSLATITKVPLTTTSANRSGEANSYSATEVMTTFGKNLSMIDLIIDGGTLQTTAPSTIIDTMVSPPRILREGPITRKDIERCLNQEI